MPVCLYLKYSNLYFGQIAHMQPDNLDRLAMFEKVDGKGNQVTVTHRAAYFNPLTEAEKRMKLVVCDAMYNFQEHDPKQIIWKC